MHFVFGALTLVALHLGWEAFNGGVQSHHFLARSDLPSVSNGWGILLVPSLTWLVARSITLPALAAAAAYGAALAVSFSLDLVTEGYLFIGLFVVSLILPTYRGGYVVGFVLGMMFTFGAVLPTIVAAVVAAFSWCAHFVFRFVRKIAGRRRKLPPLGRVI